MKFGQKLRSESVPEWTSFNVDYDELKNLIKIYTTESQRRAITIPGQRDTSLEQFETHLYDELVNQHDRVDLFAKSKAGELNRRLHFLEKQIFKYLSKIPHMHSAKSLPLHRQEKIARYNGQLERCGYDIRNLQKFVVVQHTAFHKILKKYTKWTGSKALPEKFVDEILGSPKSYSRWDFEPLMSLYTDLLTSLQAAIPGLVMESSLKCRQTNTHSNHHGTLAEPQPRHTYWNEYDNGSEQEDEPYLVYIDPNLGTFPGAKTFTYVISKAKMPVEKLKEWFSVAPLSGERQPLLGYAYNRGRERQSATDTDVDEEVYASSLDFSTGHATCCAESSSVVDQELNFHRENLFFRTMLGSFAASFVLLIVSGFLAFTGKKKLQVEVDAGVIVGIIASLFFATVGFCLMRCLTERLSWSHRLSVSLTFITACIFNCLILVEVSENK